MTAPPSAVRSIGGREVQVAHCSACKQPILWTVTMKNKRMPVDAEPHPRGNLRLVWEQDEGTAEWFLRAVFDKGPVGVFVSHFATCPEAGKFRHG